MIWEELWFRKKFAGHCASGRGSPRDFYKPGGRNYAQKYSPVGELGEFARSYAQALAQTTEALVCITDREYVIAAAGTGKKEVEGEQLSEEMEEMIEKRSTVVKTGEEQACSITKKQCQPFRRELCFQVFCAMETVRVL